MTTFSKSFRIGAFLGMLALAGSANAAFVANITQVGSNVVATGSGTINTTGLYHVEIVAIPSFVDASLSSFSLGAGVGGNYPRVDVYAGMSSPSNIGPGTGIIDADSGSGDQVAVDSYLLVPVGYESGNFLSDSSTWDNQTIAGLGLTPGTYLFTWGSGLNADSFTLNIGGAAAAPEPMLVAPVALALFALLLFVRRRPARQ